VGLIPGLAMLVGAGLLFVFPLNTKILVMHAEKAAKLVEMEGGETG